MTEQRKDEQKDRQKGNRLQKTYRTEGSACICSYKLCWVSSSVEAY